MGGFLRERKESKWGANFIFHTQNIFLPEVGENVGNTYIGGNIIITIHHFPFFSSLQLSNKKNTPFFFSSFLFSSSLFSSLLFPSNFQNSLDSFERVLQRYWPTSQQKLYQAGMEQINKLFYNSFVPFVLGIFFLSFSHFYSNLYMKFSRFAPHNFLWFLKLLGNFSKIWDHKSCFLLSLFQEISKLPEVFIILTRSWLFILSAKILVITCQQDAIDIHN